MGVRDVLMGSPADGKLLVGDVIYSANGTLLGEDAPRAMSAAITASETRELGGKLILGVRRGGKLMDVMLQLDVMGAYSPTAPYDCPKTEKIISNLERWLADRDGQQENFLSTETLFLLSAGSPEYQGLVRKAIFEKMENFTPSAVNWYLGYDAILISEYYLSTGDTRVLPMLKQLVDKMVEHQITEATDNGDRGRIGGWYGRGGQERGYPEMPNAGLACLLGMTLARETGVEVDEAAFERAVKHFRKKGADVGIMIYGNAYRDKPYLIDPADLDAGKLSTYNGMTGVCSVLFDLLGDAKTAYINSFISTYSFNLTYPGHAGNFWNNFWSPLGARVHGRPAYIHFMAGHRWYRELNRMFDGSLIVNPNEDTGAGHGLALTASRERLRILGAPRSPFAVDAPAVLQPALVAYRNRDYSQCLALIEELMNSGTVVKNDQPTVQKLAEESQRMLDSIDADLAKLHTLATSGRYYEANRYLPQLKQVMESGDARLLALASELQNGSARENDKEQYLANRASYVSATSRKIQTANNRDREWSCVLTEVITDEKDRKRDIMGKVEDEQASVWALKVLEDRSQAPEDWMRRDFDDSAWDQTTLPISWRLNHTALLRTTFQIDDPDVYDGMRFRAWLFRQQDIAIYLNGNLIGRVNNLEKKTGDVEAMFNDSAITSLRKGQNTLAIVTLQNWRWGMLFPKVYNDGFGFMLDLGKAKK
jgi:hypothetical protein